MADKLDEPEFWLPSEFLTDEDILMDNKENVSNFVGHCFPGDFQYEYGSSVLSSPVESLVGCPETESDEDDLLINGLTRQLTLNKTQKFSPTHHTQEQKVRVLSGSPQSTLTQVGSWSGRRNLSSNGSTNGPPEMSSPPMTPSEDNNGDWDLIYKAAVLVARLKMNSGGAGPTIRSPGFLGPPVLLTAPPQLRNSSPSGLNQAQLQLHSMREQMLKQETCEIWSRQVKNGWSCEMGRMGHSSCAWPSQQVHQRNQQQLYGELGVKAGVYPGCGYGYGFRYGSGGGGGGGGGGLKKERPGTGVFLPRRYDSNSFRISDSHKKPPVGSSSTAWLPNKVSQASTKNFDINAIVQQNDYFVARRNAMLAQQRRSLCPEGSSISHEICLPQEWTY